MESQRNFIIIGLAVVSYFLFVAWHQDYGPKQEITPVQEKTTTQIEINEEFPSEVSTYLPPESITKIDELPQEVGVLKTTQPSINLIHVETDVFKVHIDPRGGDIVLGQLKKHLEIQSNPDIPFTILRNSDGRTYTAMSGLVGNGMPESAKPRALYSSTENSYSMSETEDALSVTLRWTNDEGLVINKIFSFNRDSYVIGVRYRIQNTTSKELSATFFGQLKRDQMPNEDTMGGFGISAYLGSAYSTKEQRYERYDFDDMNDNNLKVTTKGGWIAYLQHYFISAWIPDQEKINTISTLTPGGLGIIRVMSPRATVQPGEILEVGGDLYLGPKIQKDLEQIADGLDLTVDYGFLWWIGQPLFWLLNWFNSIIGSWGLAIIMVTITVKSVFYPLSNAQYRSFAKMRTIQPKVTALKERIGDDRQKMSQAMMELYKKEKVNPLGGCLPLLVQMPVFIALYWVLLETVELRHADFYFWIHDLSAKDPYFILPLLMGASMFLMQKMQPTAATMDPMQQKIMQFLPVIMTVFFLFFPAGLVLYWLVNNLLSIAQQLYVTRKIEREFAAKQAASKK
ncbi:MAG: membrane protein insertase YidC [Gammaproteobacteria bacterium]|nr:MAG: membrane protein insertase YidC [Gammaproteobacteria bacterium]